MLPRADDCTEGGITQSGDGALAHCGTWQMAPGGQDSALIAPALPDPDLWLELDGHMTITACQFHPPALCKLRKQGRRAVVSSMP
jgi:hypothetical protein